jgi:T4 superinfection immunity protein
VWVIFAALYFIPAIVANDRKHHNRYAIYALNLLLGWTVIGWIAALVWALTAVRFDLERDADRY